MNNDIFISKNDLNLLESIYQNRLPGILKKINRGYPIQYLIGYVDFLGNKILVNKNVLIPRFETELLVDKTIKTILDKKITKARVLEIGTGSGCISISLKKAIPTLTIDAIDISSKALKLASENAKTNNIKINFIKKSIEKYNCENYDIIISNPPYISHQEKISLSVHKYEPKKALYARNNGLYFYNLILQKSLKLLNKKGIIAFEIGCTQANDIIKLTKKYYPQARILLEKDLNTKDRYIFIFNE